MSIHKLIYIHTHDDTHTHTRARTQTHFRTFFLCGMTSLYSKTIAQ